MQIKLSDHFTYSKLLRFTLPSIIMMIISSIYSVVDGLFVSNLVGELALSAVNILFPPSALSWAPEAEPLSPGPWVRETRTWPTATSP